jgi:hypothetical protein
MTDMGFTADILPQESLLYRASRHTECVQEPLYERNTKSILRNVKDALVQLEITLRQSYHPLDND